MSYIEFSYIRDEKNKLGHTLDSGIELYEHEFNNDLWEFEDDDEFLGVTNLIQLRGIIDKTSIIREFDREDRSLRDLMKTEFYELSEEVVIEFRFFDSLSDFELGNSPIYLWSSRK